MAGTQKTLFAISVKRDFFNPFKKRWMNGWISAFGYTTVENSYVARRFHSAKKAEEFAFMLAAKLPHYIGKLKVVPIGGTYIEAPDYMEA